MRILDGESIYTIHEQLKADLGRSPDIQFYQGKDLIPNPVHHHFIFSHELAQSPRGLQFFHQLHQRLIDEGVEPLV